MAKVTAHTMVDYHFTPTDRVGVCACACVSEVFWYSFHMPSLSLSLSVPSRHSSAHHCHRCIHPLFFKHPISPPVAERRSALAG